MKFFFSKKPVEKCPVIRLKTSEEQIIQNQEDLLASGKNNQIKQNETSIPPFIFFILEIAAIIACDVWLYQMFFS